MRKGFSIISRVGDNFNKGAHIREALLRSENITAFGIILKIKTLIKSQHILFQEIKRERRLSALENVLTIRNIWMSNG